jgi:hypothetical protein
VSKVSILTRFKQILLIKNELLRAVEKDRNRFQPVTAFIGPTPYDGDNSSDPWLYEVEDIKLNITYRP